MDELESQFNILSDQWESARETLETNPQILQQHLKDVEVSDLDFLINLIQDWSSKFPKPSKRQKNAYHLSLALYHFDIQTAITRLRQFNSGQHQQLRPFVESLFKCANHLNSMAAINADLDQELGQATSSAFISAAQELRTALTEVEQLRAMGEEIHAMHQELADIKESANGRLAEIHSAQTAANEHREAAEESSGQAASSASHAADLVEQLTAHKEDYSKLADNTETLRGTLDQLIESAQEHDNTIKDLLPRATSAGLAAAFEQKARDMRWPKVLWLSVFILSIAGLLTVGTYFGQELIQPDPAASVLAAVQRAPLFAPLIWLGWFSARQYGHVDRLQEDYTYKTAISRAFEGYKNQMEDLGDTNTNKALEQLCEQTIAILAKDPMRSYSRKPDEVPSSSITNGLFGKKADDK